MGGTRLTRCSFVNLRYRSILPVIPAKARIQYSVTTDRKHEDIALIDLHGILDPRLRGGDQRIC